jgi:3',5'-cyclic AMP phosphodiesterase CpdA
MDHVPAAAPKPTLLHLTDLHFGAPEAKGHYWNSEATELSLAPHNRRGLVGSLVRDLRQQGLRPDLVIVTGDLLDRGAEAGVPLAVAFLAALAERLELSRSRFVIVPGNHDVLRVPDPARRYAAFDAIRAAFDEGERPAVDAPLPPHLRVERFDFAEELGIEVVGFNSCEELDPAAGVEHGSVEIAQRDRAEELLDGTRGRGLVRIAAMHHHLESPVGVARDDYSVMADAGATRRWLARQRFHLALHGHQHVDWQDVREIEGWFLSVAAAGSAGVARYGREAWQLQLGYQVIVMDGPTAGRRIRREYDPQSMEWTAAGRGAAVQRLRFGQDPAVGELAARAAPALASGPPAIAAPVRRSDAGPVSMHGRFTVRIEHLEREIQRRRAELRARVFPRAFFAHQDAMDTLAFLKSGYARCERRPDPELLVLLNDRFQRLV